MRLMSGLSLAAALILGGMMGACQPTKPCHCVQSGGCRCPLPPPPKEASPSKEQPGQTQSTATATHAARHGHETLRGSAASGQDERLAYRHRHRTRLNEAGTESQRSAKEHKSLVARPGRHFRRTHEAPASHSGGALSYDYHSTAGSASRRRFAMDERESGDFEEDHSPYGVHHYAEREHDARYFEPARMSINSQEALAPWRGYGVACPDRDDRK